MEYKSENGYSGILYGTSSMTVFNPEGKAVLHTGDRNVQTFDELKELVDTMPEFMEKLNMLVENRLDIRNVDGLWCDDITFCPEHCEWDDCPRNSDNIRDKSVPHSFCTVIPLDCPKRIYGLGEEG